MERRIFLKLSSMIAGGLALQGICPTRGLGAQETYPERRITWIVPVKPGGGFDQQARFLAPHVNASLKELRPLARGGGIVIKNIPEAGGRRAYHQVFTSRPNGYTFGDFNLGFITENIFSKPDFDVNEFTFLLRTGVSVRSIATRKDGFRSWNEMMKAAKEKEIKWAAGNFGRGAHIDSILVKETMAIPAKLINFSGTAESISAIIRGDVQVGLFSLDSIASMLKAGEFRLLTVFDEKSEYPGVPSIKDLGYPDLAENIRYHRFIVGPPGIPAAIVDVLVEAFKKTLAKKEVIDWADKMDFPLLPLYGKESEKTAKKIMNFYIKMTPTLAKYLK